MKNSIGLSSLTLAIITFKNYGFNLLWCIFLNLVSFGVIT